MKKFSAMTGLYALSHFIVDFSCAFLMFSKLHGSEQWLLCLLIYNFFAFAVQMPLGLVADYVNKNRHFAALGCVFVMLSPLFSTIPVLFCAIAGFGNALFHIGAGRDVLCGSGTKYFALGVFVSPGAIGLFLGAMLAKSGGLPLLAVLLVLIADTLLIMLAIPKLYGRRDIIVEPQLNRRSPKRVFLFMLLCLFLVVCLRSYVGITLSFPWKKEGSFALFLVISVVLGKAFGGILADRFGALTTSFVTLAVCSVLFLFYKLPVCGILAVFLFNMTMPITLGAVKKLMPDLLGFGFGILTFGLFLGTIPTFLNMQNALVLPYGYSAACIASAGLLYFGFKGPYYAD